MTAVAAAAAAATAVSRMTTTMNMTISEWEASSASTRMMFSLKPFEFGDSDMLRALYRRNQESRRLLFEKQKTEKLSFSSASGAVAPVALPVETKAPAVLPDNGDWLARTLGDSDLLSPPLDSAAVYTLPVSFLDGFTLDGHGDPSQLEIKAATEAIADLPDDAEHKPGTTLLAHLTSQPRVSLLSSAGFAETLLDEQPTAATTTDKQLTADDVRLVFYSVADPLAATFTDRGEADLVRLILAEVRTQLPARSRVLWEKRRPTGPSLGGSMRSLTDVTTDGATFTRHSFTWDGLTAAAELCIPGVQQQTRDSAAAFAVSGPSDVLIWLWPADDRSARPSLRFGCGGRGAVLEMDSRRGRDWHAGVTDYERCHPLAVAATDSLEFRMRKEFKQRQLSQQHGFEVIDVFYSTKAEALENVLWGEARWFSQNCLVKHSCCVHRVDPEADKRTLREYQGENRLWRSAADLVTAYATKIIAHKTKTKRNPSRLNAGAGDLTAAMIKYKEARLAATATAATAVATDSNETPTTTATTAVSAKKRKEAARDKSDERPLKRICRASAVAAKAVMAAAIAF